jgi:hypothetical protein
MNFNVFTSSYMRVENIIIFAQTFMINNSNDLIISKNREDAYIQIIKKTEVTNDMNIIRLDEQTPTLLFKGE